MFAPPTNGYRILVYGTDSTLLETRRMLLASTGFRVDTVSNLKQFRHSVDRAQPRYELYILCHTVPSDEQDDIQELAEKSDTGLYQLKLMERPIEFMGTIEGMRAGS